MSLMIDLDRVYKNSSVQASGEETALDCYVKVTFREVFYHRYLCSDNNKCTNTTEDIDDDDDIDDRESEKLLADTNERIVFRLGSEIQAMEKVQLDCFKSRNKRTPFGQFAMLLEGLILNETLNIDEFLVEPKRQTLSNKRIAFHMEYTVPQFNKQVGIHTYHVDSGEDDIEQRFLTGSDDNNKKTIRFSDLSENDLDNNPKISPFKSPALLRDAIGRSTLNMAQTAFNPNFILQNNEDVENEDTRLTHLAAITKKGLNKPFQRVLGNMLTSTLDNKVTSWQIRVQIIELKYLSSGANERVYCTVEIGNQKFYSSIKSIDKLLYNETFKSLIENVITQKVLNYLIVISVYFKRFIFKSDVCVGVFQIDLGTIYKQPGHEFFHKWTQISSLDDGSSKGYLKCDLIVQARGDKVEVHDFNVEDMEKEEDIDNNLLQPYGLEHARSPIKIMIDVYLTDIYVAEPNTIFNTIRRNMSTLSSFIPILQKAETNSEQVGGSAVDLSASQSTIVDMAEPIDEKSKLFIHVTFAGVTKIVGALSKERLIFNCIFPPYIRLFKFELFSETKLLATEYLKIDDISNHTTDFFYLPTMGPCHFDLLTEPANCRTHGIIIRDSTSNATNIGTIEDDDDIFATKNELENELKSQVPPLKDLVRAYIPVSGCTTGGGDYVARLFLQITSTRLSNYPSKRMERIEWLNRGAAKNAIVLKSFTAFAFISDATMIDYDLCDKKLSFQLSVGTYGNKFSLEYSNDKYPINETVPDFAICLGPRMPYYLPFDKTKQCVTLKFKIEDVRYLMYKKNIIANSTKHLLNVRVKSLQYLDKNELDDYLTNAKNIKAYLEQDYFCSENITELERFRVRQILVELQQLMDTVKTFCEFDAQFRKFHIINIRERVSKIRHYLSEPLNYFPDIKLWMLADGERVGVCTFNANDVIWHEDRAKRGLVCNKMVYTDFKTLCSANLTDPLSENVARIRLYLWLGLSNQTDAIFPELLDGYLVKDNYKNKLNLPSYLFFNECHSFEMRAHIFQGRDLIGLDSTGLSDPYLRISMGNQSVYSQPIYQTNNPKWNMTFTIPQVNVYGQLDAVLANPPEIIVEIFDEDTIGKNEFMGRRFVKPTVNLTADNPPKLKWRNLLHPTQRAGDFLASFEIILLDEEAKKKITNKPEFLSIPESIMPVMCPYSLEILYWGLRNIKNTNSILFSYEKYIVRIEIGANIYEADMRDLNSTNSNFQVNNHQKHTLLLPENDDYKPHLNIRCLRETSLKERKLLGSFTVKSIGDYNKSLEQLKAHYKNYTRNNFSRLMSSQPDYGLDETQRISVEEGRDNGAGVINNRHLRMRRFRRHATKSYFEERKKHYVVKTNEVTDDLEYLDWWSKYYASTKPDYEATLDRSNSFGLKVTQEDGAIDEVFEEEAATNHDSEYSESSKSNSSKLDQKKKKKHTNRKQKRLKRIIKKNETILEKIELKKHLMARTIAEPTVKDVSFITRIFDLKRTMSISKMEIYDCELENVNELKGMSKMLETYPLLKGKYSSNLDMVQCQFKGNFLLYKEDDELVEEFKVILKRYGGFLKMTPPNNPVMVKLRVYVVKAFIFNTVRLGWCDPYLFIELAEHQVSGTVQNNTLKPIFGSVFEFDVKFPHESQLSISIKDRNILGGASLIGKTIIDLEDRFYSNRYATCGIAKDYEREGYNAWRDILEPTQILKKMCAQWRLAKPVYNELTNTLKIICVEGNTKEYKLKKIEFDSVGKVDDVNVPAELKMLKEIPKDVKLNKETLALMALNDWQSITGVSLVAEHLETRSLYNPEAPDMEQGKVLMWVDMFAMDELSNHHDLPKPVDISPRYPKKFQLRINIYNTTDVILDDVNPVTGEKTSDIYVKGFLCDLTDQAQKTDTHFRSMNGEGNFNWRFVFDFDYLPAEEVIVYSKRDNTFSLGKKEFKMEPIINLQCWDADLLINDDFLGKLELNLCRMIRGARTADTCNMAMLKNKDRPYINLFKVRNHRGWWPFVAEDGRRNKLTGKLEAEFFLVNEQQAKDNPVGLGREDPEALPEPTRPQNSFLWFMNPLATFRFVIWKNYKWLIIKLIFVLLIVVFILLFIYQLPSVIINKALSFFG